MVWFDRGTKKGPRTFQSVDGCVEMPCIVTQYGAWQFTDVVVARYRVEMSYFHEGSLHPIGIFQQSTTLEQKLGERLLNRHPNRKIVNLMQMVEQGKTPTIFMYGVLLQYEIRDGDPVIVRLTRFDDPTDVREYYFRYHKTGPVPDIDIALLYPIGYFHPNPNYTIQGATAGAAFSFSIGSHMDPERKYGWFRKALRAVRLNIFTGLVTRKELQPIGGDLVVSDSVDGFGGLGVTVFDFLNLGYGINFVRTPHSTFPFVGIEVKHVFEFLRSLKQDTHTKWEKYLREEREQRGEFALPRSLGQTVRSK